MEQRKTKKRKISEVFCRQNEKLTVIFNHRKANKSIVKQHKTMGEEKNTVTVQIRAAQTVHYSQIHEIDREEWEELQSDNSDELYEQLASGYLDLRDISDAEEIEDVEIIKV